MEEMQELLSEMERRIREIIRVGGMSDEDEEAISRVIDQLIQCGLLIEGETTERVVLMQQLRYVQSCLTKRAEDMELQRRINSRQRRLRIVSQKVIFTNL